MKQEKKHPIGVMKAWQEEDSANRSVFCVSLDNTNENGYKVLVQGEYNTVVESLVGVLSERRDLRTLIKSIIEFIEE